MSKSKSKSKSKSSSDKPTEPTTTSKAKAKSGGPTYQSVNRQLIPMGDLTLVKRTLYTTEASLNMLSKFSEQMRVTQGSILDAALRELLAKSPEQIIETIQKHGHLNEAQARYVLNSLDAANETTLKPTNQPINP